MDDNSLTHSIIGLAMRVHTRLGPGLLESAYEACLCRELDRNLNCGYRADLIVDGRVLLELKSVECILPVHEAQLLTYLRMSGCHIGLLLNFNTLSLKDGIRRRVVGFA